MNFPNPGYQQPQQAWGQQPQQGQPQQPAPATQSADDWFGEANRRSGGGAPSFHFDQLGDTVVGEIVDMEGRQRTSMDTGALLFFPDGQPQMQLVVTLQTDLRNWQQVSNVPTTKDQAGNDVPLGPEHDDGKRRIYVWYTLKEAVMLTLQQAGVQSLKVGDQLAIRFSGTRPNPKVKNGKPSKEYQVQYRAGSPAADAYFAQEQAQQQAPAPQAPPAAPPQPYQQPQQGFPPAAPPQQQFAQAPQAGNAPPF